MKTDHDDFIPFFYLFMSLSSWGGWIIRSQKSNVQKCQMYLPPMLRNVQKCPMYLKRKYRGSCDPEAWWKWRLESSSYNSVRKIKKLYRKVGVYYFFEKRVAGGVPCPALPPQLAARGQKRKQAPAGACFRWKNFQKRKVHSFRKVPI